MNPDLSLVLALRRVLGLVTEGSGMAQALVRELRGGDPRGRYAARRILLGYPIPVSLARLERGGPDEIGLIATLIVGSAESSSQLIGETGEAVTITVERWLKTKENARLEDRVARFRSLIASFVLGAVAAIIATLGPLVGALSFSATPELTGSRSIFYAAVGMTAASSAMLGLFMSGRRFGLNVAASLSAFVFVSALASPLSPVPATSVWGIK